MSKIYANFEKTEHPFNTIEWLEKKILVYAPAMEFDMILVFYGITLLPITLSWHLKQWFFYQKSSYLCAEC